MGSHAPDGHKSLLIAQAPSVPGFVCVIDAPGFGKPGLLAGLADHIDPEALRAATASRTSPGRTERAQRTAIKAPAHGVGAS